MPRRQQDAGGHWHALRLASGKLNGNVTRHTPPKPATTCHNLPQPATPQLCKTNPRVNLSHPIRPPSRLPCPSSDSSNCKTNPRRNKNPRRAHAPATSSPSMRPERTHRHTGSPAPSKGRGDPETLPLRLTRC